jgi:hypothetical protein
MSCGNNSTFVVADDDVITWGPSPTYGELGYGDPSNNPKSSTVPKIVESLKVRASSLRVFCPACINARRTLCEVLPAVVK